MKWYFCLNEDGIGRYGQIAMVAVESALANTSLIPYLLYDGNPNSFTRWMEARGVTLVRTKVRFLDELLAVPDGGGFSPNVARGAYLRLDISEHEHEDNFVLYTDVDVVFNKDPEVEKFKPDLLGAVCELWTGGELPSVVKTKFNSGVMILNLDGMRKTYENVLDVCRRSNFYFEGRGGYYDQGALNEVYSEAWEELPPELNWRPFQGANENAAITHFHGTKPYEIQRLLDGKTDGISPVARKIFYWDVASYGRVLKDFRSYIPPNWKQTLLECADDVHGVDNEYLPAKVQMLKTQLPSYYIDEQGSEIFNEAFSVALTKLNATVIRSEAPLEGNLFYFHQEKISEFDAPNPRRIHKRRNFYRALRGKRRILEVGFNAGHSTLMALASDKHIFYSGIDICFNKYTKDCAAILKDIFGDRLELTFGDSRHVLPEIWARRTERFDLIHIDGGHGSEVCIADIANGVRLSSDDSHLLVDDTSSPRIMNIFQEFCNRGVLATESLGGTWEGSENVYARVIRK